jgi:ornithine cyclodeaminase/alanine dehydrogenase-like protein (mu-crystallin family)
VPIYLREKDVAEFLDMPAAIAALREAFVARAREEASIVPRRRWTFGDRRLNVMGGGIASQGRFALKSYGSSAFHVLLYSMQQGLLAIMEANVLGQIRTGAASALASKAMARRDACKVALIGTGRQARTQALALHAAGLLAEFAVSARDRA